jgi:hypothetical protein
VTSDLRLTLRGPRDTDRDEWDDLVDHTPVAPGIGQRYDAWRVDAEEGIRSSFALVRENGGRLVGGARLTIERRLPLRHVEMFGGPLYLPGYEDSVRPLVARAVQETVSVVDSGMLRPSSGHAWHLEKFGMHRSNAPVETVFIDLRPTEDALWRGVDHSVRQGVRKARDHGLTIREVTEESEIPRIYPLIARFGRYRDFAIVSEKRLRAMHRIFRPTGHWHILLGETGSTPAGVALVWVTNQQSGLMVLASAPEFAKVQLTSLLAWEAVRSSKLYGATSFDFLGLPPAGSGLEGVRRFKLKWGGVIVPGEEYLEGVAFRYVTDLIRRHPKMFNAVLMGRGPFRGGLR